MFFFLFRTLRPITQWLIFFYDHSQFPQDDLSANSVLQYAIDYVGVEHGTLSLHRPEAFNLVAYRRHSSHSSGKYSIDTSPSTTNLTSLVRS